MISRSPERLTGLVSARFYSFGPFCLDTVNHSVSRNGQLVPLQPKAYEVLWMLIQNAGRTVTRKELKNAIWGADIWVEESTLGFQINQARKALGDDPNDPQYIKTFHRRGFRFIANVRALEEIEGSRVFINGTPHEDGNVSVDAQGGVSVDKAIPPAASMRRLQLSLAGHAPYVICASAIYAAYFGVALLVEIAYQFDRYGSTARLIAIVISCFVFLSSLLGLSLGTQRTLAGSRGSLLVSVAVFVVGASAVFIGARRFLPAESITLAKFQTFTAQAAYLKDLCYIVPLGLTYLVLPFHFIVAMERELRSEAPDLAVNLLTGEKPSASPRGTVFLRIWFLLLFLILMLTYSLIARTHLFDNLKDGMYMSLFQSLIHVRIVLFFGLAILCLAWYYRALEELRRDCAIRRILSRQTS